MEEVIIKIIMIVVTTFCFVAAIMPFIKKVAMQIGAVDIPRTRHIHTKPMPKMGGVGIFLGFLLGYMLFSEPSIQMNSILIGSFIIIVTGIVDDINPIPAKIKFLFQIIAASVVAFYGEILLNDLSAFGFYINFGNFSYLITIIFMID